MRDHENYPLPPKVAHRLAQARLSADILGEELSQRKLAEMLQVRSAAIGRIERGEAQKASFGLVAAMAFSHGINLEELVHGNPFADKNPELEFAIHNLRHLLTKSQQETIIRNIKTAAKENKLNGVVVKYFAPPKISGV
jgi:transcriptional regulator with XRE-family HTH domain